MFEKIMNSKYSPKVILLLIVLFVIFYFFKIGTVPYVRADEGWFTEGSYVLAEKGYYGSPMFTGYYGAENSFHFHPPLHYVLQAGVFKLFGFGILQGRLLSLFLTLSALFIFYQVILLLLSDKEKIFKLLPILLVLSTPLSFVIARTIRPENSVLFFGMLAYYLLIRNILRQKSIYLLIGAGICSACAIIANISGAFILFFAIVILFAKDRRGIFPFLSGFAIPSFIYVLWIIANWPDFYGQVILQRSGEVNHISAIAVNIIGFFMDKVKVTIHASFLMIFMTYALVKKREVFNKDYWLFYFLPFITFGFQLLFLPHINPLYFVLLLPFIYLNFAYVYSNLNRSYFFSILLVLLLAVNIFGDYKYFKQYDGYDYETYINRLTKNIPYDSVVLGEVSLYPGIHNKGYSTYYAYENARITGGGDYQTLKKRIKEYKIDIIILDAWYGAHQHPGFAEFFNNDVVEIDRFVSPDYGSEGESRNNLIRIYRVKAE
ncbi:ArnT family glycosyltransferase [Candidatus Margulisiibacteriota bacterium]